MLPKLGANANEITKLCVTVIRNNPKLLECTPESLIGAVIKAKEYGLSPVIGECYLVPYKKKEISECQFQIGYKGAVKLVSRADKVSFTNENVVYQNDEFRQILGLNPNLIHFPAAGDRGDIIGVYSVVHFKDGSKKFVYMTKKEVEKRRDSSSYFNYLKKEGRLSESQWMQWTEEMYKKTVLLYISKTLPMSVDDIAALQSDESAVSLNFQATDSDNFLQIESRYDNKAIEAAPVSTISTDSVKAKINEAQAADKPYTCSMCPEKIDKNVYDYSTKQTGRALCFKCQKKHKNGELDLSQPPIDESNNTENITDEEIINPFEGE